MKKKLLITIVLSVCALMCYTTEANAQKKAKEKKEKKPFEWTMPDKLSGEKELDEYLLYGDTIWNRIQAYRESISFFRVDTVLVTDKETNTNYYAVKIVDQHGVERSWSQSILQGVEIVLGGTGIVLDAAMITLMATNAGLVFTQKPLLAMSYGKYVKNSTGLLGVAYGEVKEITNQTKTQIADIKSIHQNKTEKSTDMTILIPIPEDEEINLDDLTDLADIDLGTNDNAIDLPDLDDLDLDKELNLEA